MNISFPYRLISGFMSTLLLWNLCGWWLYPVVHGMVDKHTGEVCCNGAEICCCKAAGADACYCLSDQGHGDSEAIVCGISVPNDHTNAQKDGILVFIEFRAIVSQSANCIPKNSLTTLFYTESQKPSFGFLQKLLRPPQA